MYLSRLSVRSILYIVLLQLTSTDVSAKGVQPLTTGVQKWIKTSRGNRLFPWSKSFRRYDKLFVWLLNSLLYFSPYSFTYLFPSLSTLRIGHPAWVRLPLSCLFPPLSIHFLIFCSVYFSLFFSRSLYLFSFVHPFYQNSHHSVAWPEIVGSDRTWV